MNFTIDELIKECSENLVTYNTQKNATQQAFHQICGAIQLMEAQMQHLINKKQEHAIAQAQKEKEEKEAADAAAAEAARIANEAATSETQPE